MGKRIDNTSCHCLKLRRSAENVIVFYDRMLKPSGVTVRQYSLLREIARQDGCSTRALAKATELDPSTLARNLKPLLSQGLVADKKAPGSRDRKLVLTPQGKQTEQAAAALWAKAQAVLEEKLGAERVCVLEDTLLLLQDL